MIIGKIFFGAIFVGLIFSLGQGSLMLNIARLAMIGMFIGVFYGVKTQKMSLKSLITLQIFLSAIVAATGVIDHAPPLIMMGIILALWWTLNTVAVLCQRRTNHLPIHSSDGL